MYFVYIFVNCYLLNNFSFKKNSIIRNWIVPTIAGAKNIDGKPILVLYKNSHNNIGFKNIDGIKNTVYTIPFIF